MPPCQGGRRGFKSRLPLRAKDEEASESQRFGGFVHFTVPPRGELSDAHPLACCLASLVPSPPGVVGRLPLSLRDRTAAPPRTLCHRRLDRTARCQYRCEPRAFTRRRYRSDRRRGPFVRARRSGRGGRDTSLGLFAMAESFSEGNTKKHAAATRNHTAAFCLIRIRFPAGL